MPTVTFIDLDDHRHKVTADTGQSLMEVAVAHGIDLEGACGGALACATCHVIVDEAWAARLPAVEEDEEEMLDLAINLSETSRLGCQIPVTPELDGLVVRLPDPIPGVFR